MYRRTVLIVHLVKLVDQAVALIRQHQRAALECPLARHGVLAHARGKTDRRRALTRREYGPMRSLLDVLEELRFCGSWVAQQQHVDVPAYTHLSLHVLRDATEERERDGSLDVLVTVDRRRDGLDDALPDTVVPRERAYLLLVFLCQAEGGEEVLLFVDVVRFDDGRKDGEAIFRIQRRVKIVAVNARYFLF